MGTQTAVDLRDLDPKRYELVAALAVNALCRIANYENPEDLRTAEEADADADDGFEAGGGYGLDPDEVIEMAYDNVLSEARAAVANIRRALEPTPTPDKGSEG